MRSLAHYKSIVIYSLLVLLVINCLPLLHAMDIQLPIEKKPLIAQQSGLNKLCERAPAMILLIPAAGIPVFNSFLPYFKSNPFDDCFFSPLTIALNGATFLLIVSAMIILHKKN